MPSGTPLPAPPNVAGLDFKDPFQPQWFCDFILAAPRLLPGPDPTVLGALHSWAQVNHSSTHSSFQCQCFISCQTPNPSAQARLSGGFGCRQQPQPSWPWLKTGESPGRLCLTLPTLMAAPFPAEKNPAISSQLCHEITPILGQRLPQAQSSSLSQQEKPNPLRGRGGPRLGTSTESNFEARKTVCPKPILAPSKAQLRRTEVPTWQHQPRAGLSPAEPQQALTCQAEPTWSKPQARLRAGSADPGREEGQIQETVAGEERWEGK